MLFTLIKNELIKLLRKAKTWIVFGLFAIFIAVTIFAQYKSDKNIREWRTPEKQLEMAQDNLEYYNNELKNSKDSNINPEYISYLEGEIENSKNQIETYQDIIKNGLDEKAWKLQLDEEIKWTKESIENYKQYNDEWSKQYLMEAQEQLEMYTYLKDNNIEPLYGWEYEAYNYMTSLMQFLGMAILLCGIAVFMSDIVSGECTPATLKFLLVQPVTRGKVLLSKFLSVTLVVLAMIIGGELIGFSAVSLTSNLGGANYPVNIGTQYNKIINSEGSAELVKVIGSGHMGTNSELLIKAMLFQVLFIITSCAVVFLISTLIKSSMITMAVSVVVTVFLTIASQSISALKDIAHLLFVNYGDAIGVFSGNSAVMFKNSHMTVQNGIIVMVITSIVAYAIAHINFKNKDILI
ncbi:ABC transporter permease subunit [Clostridioides difficile]